MINSIKNFVKNKWLFILVAISIVALIINILLFYPGYMSNDTLAMFNASRGQTPTNMAPVLIGLTWRVLYNLTGQTSSILIFQLAMLWSALCLFAIYIHKKTGSKLLSLLCLAIGGLPFVVNISGVIWRDNHMTFALALAFALFLFAKDMVNEKRKMLMFIVIFVLTLYAALSRYNALFGVIPIVFLFVHFSGYVKKVRWQFVITALFIPLTILSFPIVDATLGVRKIDNSPGLLLDDIIRVSKESDIKNITMPSNLRSLLLSVRRCSMAENVLVSNIYVCLRPGDDAGILYRNSGEFRRIWLQVLSNNPISYVSYKMQMFASVLVPQTDYAYIWQSGIDANSYGEYVKFQNLGNINYNYVHKVGYRYMRAFFEPWLWIIAGVIIFCISLKRKTEHSLIIQLLISSAILYILGYIPTGAATDFRYIYWSVFAIIFGFILYQADRYNSKNLVSKKTTK